MISREEIVWLYRCFLNREPESDSVIEKGMAIHPNFESARLSFIMAREFRDVWLPAPVYRPESIDPKFTPTGDYGIAISAIVKNEENYIVRMIESCLPIASFFSIVDTGSTDQTVVIMKQFLTDRSVPHHIQTAPFIDFSTSRNLSLEAVPDFCGWILVMDADEHLVIEDVPEILSLIDRGFDGWSLPRFNFVDSEKMERPSPYPDLQMRLFRHNILQPVRYVGAVHERPIGVETWGVAPVSMTHHGGTKGGPHIHHMGRVIVDAEKERRRQQLYHDLTQKTCKISDS